MTDTKDPFLSSVICNTCGTRVSKEAPRCWRCARALDGSEAPLPAEEIEKARKNLIRQNAMMQLASEKERVLRKERRKRIIVFLWIAALIGMVPIAILLRAGWPAIMLGLRHLASPD